MLRAGTLRRGGSMQSLMSMGSRFSRASLEQTGMALPSTASVIAGVIGCIIVGWLASVSLLLMIVALRYTGPVAGRPSDVAP